MIHLRLPEPRTIDQLHAAWSESSYSYPEVGGTSGPNLPAGYNIDRSSVVLGEGEATLARARAALQRWAAFELPWVRAHPQAEPAPGVQIAVVARVLGVWWANLNRVVEVVDEADHYAFSYGTLPYHVETGEERFSIRRDPFSDAVRYEILAFSRPRHLLARLGYPLSRATQHRFARGSLAAMQAAVHNVP